MAEPSFLEHLPDVFGTTVFAKAIGVNNKRIRQDIATGRLRAINLANAGVRPNYRISKPDALEYFVSCYVQPPVKASQRRRRKKNNHDLV